MNELKSIALYLVVYCVFGAIYVNTVYGEITESRFVGGKVVGKGGAVTADEMGASSVFFNPAALAYQKKTMEFWVAFGQPYEEVKGFSLLELSFSAGLNLQFLQTAIGFRSFGDYNSLSYNFIYLTAAKNFSLGDLFINKVAAGVNLKLIDIHAANVPGYSGFSIVSDGLGFAFDVGVQVGFFKDQLIFGINAKNIVSTPISLIAGTGDKLRGDILLGLKYAVTEFLNLTLDYSLLTPKHTVSFLNLLGDSYAFSNLYFGIEFDYFKNIEIYTGFNEGSLTLGIGLTDTENFKVDFGLWVVPGLKMYSQIGLSIMPF